MTDLESNSNPRKRSHVGRGMLLGVVIALILWALLAHYWIFIVDTGMVILKKTSWTFDSCVVIEQTWVMFAFHHPILASRLALGDGFWVFTRGSGVRGAASCIPSFNGPNTICNNVLNN